jgi:hypothetical protein
LKTHIYDICIDYFAKILKRIFNYMKYPKNLTVA